jgi:hypothetical protein
MGSMGSEKAKADSLAGMTSKRAKAGAKEAAEKGLIAASAEDPGLKPADPLALFRGLKTPAPSERRK